MIRGMQGPAPAADGAARGMTLVEVMVSISVLSVLFMVILKSTLTVGDAGSTLESFNTIIIETRKAISDIHQDIATARKIYEEDVPGLGRSYINNMLFTDPVQGASAALPPISSNLLPVITTLGTFDQDVVGARKTGNFLLVVGEMSPADYTDTSILPNATYRVNVFRLVAYYLTDYGKPISPGLSHFDLVRWESPAYADYTTLTSITNLTARTLVINNLVNNLKITHAWDPSQFQPAAFFRLTTIVAATPDATYKIPPSPVKAKWPKPYYRLRNAAIAPNNSILATEAAVPKFAQKAAAAGAFPGFPHGFEVKVVGPSGARKVMTRLVGQRAMRGQIVQGKSESIATMRDI